MDVKRIKKAKKRLERLEHEYMIRHKKRGFLGYVRAMNIHIVRKRFPEHKGYTVYKRR